MIDENKVIDLLMEGKVTPIELERIINSLTRLEAGVPTGTQQVNHDSPQNVR